MEKGLLKKKKILQIISVTVKVVTYKLKKVARKKFWVPEEIVRHLPSEIYATSQGLKELVHDSSKCTRNRKTGENSMLLFFLMSWPLL